jgi:hypothetical protein
MHEINQCLYIWNILLIINAVRFSMAYVEFIVMDSGK